MPHLSGAKPLGIGIAIAIPYTALIDTKSYARAPHLQSPGLQQTLDFGRSDGRAAAAACVAARQLPALLRVQQRTVLQLAQVVRRIALAHLYTIPIQ